MKTTHLEMRSASDLRPSKPSTLPYRLVRAEIPSPEFGRFLYTAVGSRWVWYSRLPWDRARWLERLESPDVEMWVAYVAGTPAGYFEIERHDDETVEIVYFGLLPDFLGKGLGGALLTDAVRRAWEMGAKRVSVHTCDLDGPQALRNYEARGFRVFKTEEAYEDLPDGPIEPWPGANAPSGG